MTPTDPSIAALLDRQVPLRLERSPDWPDVLQRAGRTEPPALEDLHGRSGGRRRPLRLRGRRLVLVTLAATLALLIPVLAVGASQGWWFQQPHQVPWWWVWPYPINGAPTILATGHIHNKPWTAVAFVTGPHGKPLGPAPHSGEQKESLCFSFIIGSRSNLPSAASCGHLYGMNGGVWRKIGGWMTYANDSRPNPPLVTGAVAQGVARVEIILNPYPYFTRKPKTVKINLTSSPRIGDGIQFFTYRYPANIGIEYIVLYNKQGKVIKRYAWG